MYPTFCIYDGSPEAADDYFAQVAASCGLGARRPGFALGEDWGNVTVVVAVDGTTVLLPAAKVFLQVPDSVILSLMEAMEEAIEDLSEEPASGEDVLAARERLLAQMEGAWGGD